MQDPKSTQVRGEKASYLSALAASAGCCGASCKEDCQRPPCPCNLDAWTPLEREDILIAAQKKAA